MDPNNQTATAPQSADDPSLVTDPQGVADEPAHDGNAQVDEGENNSSQQAPEPPKYVHQLAGDLKENPHVLEHQSLNDLVRDYVGFRSKADRLIEVPGDDADDATREAFLNQFRPETPEGYTLPEVPDGFAKDAEAEDRFRKFAHSIGLRNDQAAALRKLEISAMEQARTRNHEGMSRLRTEWGDGFDGNVNEAKAAFDQIAEQLGDAELAQRMVKNGYDKDPDMIRTFYGIRQLIKPDTLVNGDVDAGGTGSVASDWYPDTDFGS